MKRLKNWDPGLLRGIERPSRYLAGEFGLPVRGTTALPRLRVVLGFPDVYEVGMSHLGFRLLHAGLAARPDLQVERVFLPWPDFQARLLSTGRPLASLETVTPLADFDLVGLSLQYELALPAVLRLLDLGQIPRRAERRGAAGPGRRWPLILCGGSVALNPEPLAPFVDAFFIGEADHAIHEIVLGLAETREESRLVQLQRLEQIPGIYIPALADGRPGGPGRVVRRVVDDLDRLEVPPVQLVPTCAIVHDRVTVEIQRGCSQGCRFCQAGFVSRPTRQRSVARVLELAREQLRRTGYQDLSLLSLSAGDHPRLQEMLAGLIAEHGPARVSLSLPSMRTESLLPAVADHLSKVRKTGFTLAPEAATDRLRGLINKGNREEHLLESVRSVARAGFQQLKLYFMIGLPTETDDDIVAIARLGQRALVEAQHVTRQPVRMTLSISTFVPKPFTPFQWEAFVGLAEIQRRQKLLQAHVSRRLRLKWHDPGQTLVEAYLARADRRMAAVLDRLVTPDHVGLDAWTEHFSLPRWRSAIEEAQQQGELPGDEVLLGARDPSAPLPWDFIDVGVTRAYLEQERQAALRGELRPDCSDGRCDHCGVCPDEPLHRLATEIGPSPPVSAREPASDAAAPAPEVTTGSLRFWFRKQGRAALMSHLEMMDVFERAARRAELPLCFSEGYHPKAKLRFSPALTLGAESLCELLEMVVRLPLDPATAARRLGAELPPGLEIVRAEEATPTDLLGSLQAVRWRLELPSLDGRTIPPAGELVIAAQRRLEAGVKAQRSRGRELDLRSGIAELVAVDDATLLVCCRIQSGGTPRPQEILRELLGLDEEQAVAVRITRVGWMVEGGELPKETA